MLSLGQMSYAEAEAVQTDPAIAFVNQLCQTGKTDVAFLKKHVKWPLRVKQRIGEGEGAGRYRNWSFIEKKGPALFTASCANFAMDRARIKPPEANGNTKIHVEFPVGQFMDEFSLVPIKDSYQVVSVTTAVIE